LNANQFLMTKIKKTVNPIIFMLLISFTYGLDLCIKNVWVCEGSRFRVQGSGFGVTSCGLEDTSCGSALFVQANRSKLKAQGLWIMSILLMRGWGRAAGGRLREKGTGARLKAHGKGKAGEVATIFPTSAFRLHFSLSSVH
jgi:hypothetical protein